MGKPTLFIINPAAGQRALRSWRAFASKLRAQIVPFEQEQTSAPGDAFRIAREAGGTFGRVFAVGGDGTVSEVVNGLLDNQVARPALGIVPLGTGNDLASAAGIRDLTDAWQTVTAGHAKPIDLIQVDCQSNGAPVVRHAMLFASAGITSELLRHTTPGLKRLCGQRFAYIAGLLLALRHYSAPVMQITCGDLSIHNSLIFACASNGETFGGGMKIAPGARLDDGKFNVNLIESLGTLEALRHLRKLLNGQHINHPRVRYTTALEMTVKTEQPIGVAADGDLIGFTPARFKIEPAALNLLVPN